MFLIISVNFFVQINFNVTKRYVCCKLRSMCDSHVVFLMVWLWSRLRHTACFTLSLEKQSNGSIFFVSTGFRDSDIYKAAARASGPHTSFAKRTRHYFLIVYIVTENLDMAHSKIEQPLEPCCLTPATCSSDISSSQFPQMSFTAKVFRTF